jgi:hypothetical protein
VMVHTLHIFRCLFFFFFFFFFYFFSHCYTTGTVFYDILRIGKN